MAKIDIEKLIEEKGPLIESEIEKIIPKQTSIPNLYDGMWYALGSKGKRLRPILCLVAAKSLGAEEKQTLPFAAALEVIHNMTLVHDDIEDGDTIRRDNPAVWIKYGMDHGINIGDGLFACAYQLILQSNKNGLDADKSIKLFKIFTDTILTIVEGQTMDMNFRNKKNVKVAEYMDMIWRKTGILFGASVAGSALIAGASEEVTSSLIAYGQKIGPAFQIRDDILDLSKGKGRGGMIGNDIKEGKRSLMVIYALENMSETQKDKLIEILDKPRDSTTDEEVEWVIEKFNHIGAIKYAEELANKMLDEAMDILENLNIPSKEDLIEITNFIVKRQK
ncbi:MAG: polyprenyl synthetase family protein [DPANN group archaeon]|nr:polyprenyl synthetase family protein [DPANN group archaeon]